MLDACCSPARRKPARLSLALTLALLRRGPTVFRFVSGEQIVVRSRGGCRVFARTPSTPSTRSLSPRCFARVIFVSPQPLGPLKRPVSRWFQQLKRCWTSLSWPASCFEKPLVELLSVGVGRRIVRRLGIMRVSRQSSGRGWRNNIGGEKIHVEIESMGAPMIFTSSVLPRPPTSE
jgi:hypothetical protein